MKKIIIPLLVITALIFAATIATSSSFLGDKNKGYGVEVTAGGDIKLWPKTTVGRNYLSNETVISGNVSFSDATMTLDSTLTFQNAGTITNPDSLVLTESTGIKLANNTRVRGTLTSTGNFTSSATTTLGTLTGLLKGTTGVVSAATENVDYLSVAKYDSLIVYLSDGLKSIATVAISGTAEKFKTTTTAYYDIDGIQYSKSATDNIVFSDAYTINTASAAGTFYGAFLLQINAAGTVSTLAASADQVYASSANAIAALPDPAADNIAIGYIVIQSNDTDDWVANTDDMTPASDCLTSSFVDWSIKVRPHQCP